MKQLTYYALLAIGLMAGIGCGDGESTEAGTHEASFAGYVFDGSKDVRLTSYAIEVWVDGKTIKGKVDTTTGRYTLGPIRAWKDFTVTITADGYRSFRSHNSGVDLPDSLENTDQIVLVDTKRSFLFDAYLFPTSLAAPETKVVVKLPDSQDKPSGKIRLRPKGIFVLGGDTDSLGGITGQVWQNAEDMQGHTVSRDFQNGEIVLAQGDLLYGVNYDVTIYDVAGYSPLEDNEDGISAGQDVYRAYTLSKQTTEPLSIASFTAAAACTPSGVNDTTAGSTITITFNSDIELVNNAAANSSLNFLSKAESADGDNFQKTIVDLPLTGVTATASGNTVTLSWNPDNDLDVKDVSDPIRCVHYRNLSLVDIRKPGQANTTQTLQQMLVAATNGVNRSLICGGDAACTFNVANP